jgi:hypothetical protein
MIGCPSCGAENVEGTRFCVKCGTTLPAAAPSPESWKYSGDLNQPQAEQQSRGAAGDYTPPAGSAYPSYTPQQNMSYQQPQGQAQQMHPAVPAIVSLFLPGIGLLFVPNKAGLGIGIFVATIVYYVLATILTFVVVGICLFIAGPIINVVAAVHSWDEAAKASGGQFQPILFK